MGGNLTLIYSKDIINNFFIEIGLGVVSKGTIYKNLTEYPSINSRLDYDRKIRMYYGHIPFKFAYYMDKEKPSLFFSAGTYLNFGIQGFSYDSGTLSTGNQSSYYYLEGKLNGVNDFENIEFGGLFEIGYLLNKVKLAIQYQYGFTDLSGDSILYEKTNITSLHLNIECFLNLKNK